MRRRLPASIGNVARSSGGDAPSGSLRRAQLSFGLVWASETAFVVGLAVLAFQTGGVAAVGLVTAARMAAAALLAPLIATVADRVRRERVLTWIGLVRAGPGRPPSRSAERGAPPPPSVPP